MSTKPTTFHPALRKDLKLLIADIATAFKLPQSDIRTALALAALQAHPWTSFLPYAQKDREEIAANLAGLHPTSPLTANIDLATFAQNL
jgi:hypothetical protein